MLFVAFVAARLVRSRTAGMSVRLHAEWAERLSRETGLDNGYRPCGGIYLARSAGEAAALLGLADTFREEQIAIERLSPETVARLEPALAPLADGRQLKAAYLLPGEAQIRNPDHLKMLLAACRKRGVEVIDHAEAIGFEIAGGVCRSVATTKGEITARQICITSGAWTYRLLERLSIPNGRSSTRRGSMKPQRLARL